MDEQRWRRLEDLFERALALAPQEQAVFVDAQCGSDQVLANELRSLLASDQKAQSRWDGSPARHRREQSLSSNRQQALPPGTSIEGFQIRRVIGTGGVGVTYLGFDTSLERTVAIKEYCPRGIAVRQPGDTTLAAQAPDMEQAFHYGLGRFLDEARTLARFHHPSIVQVHGFLETNGTGYLIMEFEEGSTLWHTLRHGRQFDESAVMNVLMPILEGLDVVHGQSFLHRDIKPANILLRKKGPPVLLDFGAARLAMEQQTGDLTVMLTSGYAPLERYGSADQQGPWSDIYALGATAFHCMTGEAPAAATDRLERIHGAQHDPVQEKLRECSARYSNLLAQSVLWMLEPVARNRPQDAGEIIDALRDAWDGTDVGSGSDTGAATEKAEVDFEPSPALILELEVSLETHAGRVARKVVPGAVAAATRFDELVEQLAGFVLDPQRQDAFRQHALSLRQADSEPIAAGFRCADSPSSESSAHASHPDAGSPAEPTPPRPPTTTSVHAEVLQHAEHHLVRFVGPIAAVLIERAAKVARDRDEFYRLLASELDDEDERKELLARLK